ncbi:TonB-dependent receptor plug domain-containing protein [Algivirga pacifica]|uniref:TonB-dependent receptor n=1 Tax=Algivirga pacifica TaxID=1162670 RepID=A0ABP9D034_9BACT
MDKIYPLLILLIGLIVKGLPAFAQSSFDTLELGTVEVYGVPLQKYNVGTSVFQSDSLQKSKIGYSNLNDYLLQHTGIYLKESGNNGLSSISMRGGNSNHTAVLWNGININSITLGASDFNQIPLFLIEDIAVQFGGGSANFGTGSIGGSIVLSSDKILSQDINQKIGLYTSYGSYNHLFTGFKYQQKFGKWSNSTKLYFKRSDNDFPFMNLYGEKEYQNNAGFQDQGILQEISYQISSTQEISAHLWHQKHFREIQPLMGNNQQELKDESLDSNFLRTIIQYKQLFKKGQLHASSGFVRDYTSYKGDPTSTLRSENNIQADFDLNNWLSIKGGIHYQYLYSDNIGEETLSQEVTENRTALFTSIRGEITPRLQVAFNARQALIDQQWQPFAPSLGASWVAFQTPEIQWSWRAQLARNYRIPTFNERYWPLQGNPDIKAESGYSAETGFTLQWNRNGWQSSLSTTVFYNYVYNWIAWYPLEGNLWKAHNLQEVESKGSELQLGLKKTIQPDFSVQAGLNYSFTLATIQEGIEAQKAFIGEQLYYTPKHKQSSYLSITYKKYGLSLQQHYVGTRTTTDRTDILDDYNLFSSTLSRSFEWNKLKIHTSIQVNNILNTAYFNTKYMAMPGRNFMGNVHFIF